MSSIKYKNDCDRLSRAPCCLPCRVNGWHGGDISSMSKLILSYSSIFMPFQKRQKQIVRLTLKIALAVTSAIYICALSLNSFPKKTFRSYFNCFLQHRCIGKVMLVNKTCIWIYVDCCNYLGIYLASCCS
jgi:hypothetical protein